jgi:hypothetical protein
LRPTRRGFVQSFVLVGESSIRILFCFIKINFKNTFENRLQFKVELIASLLPSTMVKSRAISAENEPQAGFGKRRFAFAALLTFLLFAAFFGVAQRAAADTGTPDPGAIEATIDPTVPAAPVSPAVTQDAATGQAASADATAAQPQQSNSIEAAPTDSSGPVDASQQNEAAVAGAAANGASTSQAAGGESTADGQPSETDQQAATDQASNAAAAAVEPQQSNVVIIIRVNSPGDDSVSQTNVVSVVGAAANQGSTTQQQGSSTQDPAPAGSPASGTSDPTRSQPTGGPTPPTDGQPQSSGAVPQSAQSANAAQQPVQPTDAVQGQRPHGARALSILGSSGGSNASPPAPEHQSAAPTTATARLLGGGVSAANVASTAADLKPAASEQRSGGLVARGKRTEPIHYGIASWLDRARGAASQVAEPRRDDRPDLGLMTLTALALGLLAWVALTWLPRRSERGWRLPRLRPRG